MRFIISRDKLIKPLQMVCSVTDRKPGQVIFASILFSLRDRRLSLTGSDGEIELIGFVQMDETLDACDFTLPARKLLDICKSLGDDAQIEFLISDNKVTLRSGRSRFLLTSLPAENFPSIKEIPGAVEFTIQAKTFKTLFEKTYFAVAQQDVRYFLNGLFVSLDLGCLSAVGTDGHRLAFSEIKIGDLVGNQSAQVIVPRKAILELIKLFSDQDELTVLVDEKHMTFKSKSFIFTTNLIDGKFPDYKKVFPKKEVFVAEVEKDLLKQAISRASILSNEKHRGIRLQFIEGVIKVSANNPEREEAEEEITASYNGEPVELGFNAVYLIDILSVLPKGAVKISFSNPKSSTLFRSTDEAESSSFIVMPLQI